MKKIKLFLAAMAAMVSLGVNAQTAADFANGRYVFQNVGSGRYIGPGNAWGTTASLIQFSHFNTLNKLSDGVYKIESQVTNGGTKYYMGVDGNLFLDNAGSNIKIYDNGDGTYAMQVEGQTTYIGYDGSSTVLAQTLTNASVDNAKWKIMPYDDVYADASEENPVDVTYMIICPNFDRNHRNRGAWTMNANNQNLGGGDNTNFVAESWQSAFTLSQTITVPNGYYKLRAQAALTEYTVTGADFPVVYATSGATTVSQPFKTMQNGENSMSAMSTQFTNGNYFTDYTDVLTVTSKSITVGVKGTRTNTWCVWDNFQLLYLGPIDLTEYQTGLANAVAAAEAYESQLPAAVYANIASVITENNKSYETGDEYSAAIVAINNAVSTYATAAIVADYARYQSVKNAALAIASSTDISDSDAAVEAATTTDEIDAAIATLRAAFLPQLATLTIPQDPGYIDVTSVMVDNASVSQNVDGWNVENVVRHYSWSTGPTTNFGETEFYQSGFDFNQSVTLSAGTWEFGVTGFHRAGTYQTYFYAGEDRILLPGENSDVVNSMADAKTYFDNGNGKVALKFLLEGESNTIKIGIINEDTGTDRWTIFRDFTLKYYGAPDYSVYDDQWNDAVTAANEALDAQAYKYVSGSERTAVTEAIADAPDGSNKANYLEKIQALEAATATFKAAAPSYNAWVLAKTATKNLWGSALGVADPTTAAEAAAGVNALNVAQYNKVADDYTFSATGLIGDFGSWTGTATVAGETASPNYLDWEHWSGQTHAYYEQAATGWDNANGWTVKYEKTCTLPAGSYVIKVAARSSAGTTSTVSCSATDVTISLPNLGSPGRGINTSGVASWSDEDTFANGDIRQAANAPSVGGKGTGWQWRFLPFTLTDETEVTMTFYAEASSQHQWMSIADGELLSTTKLAQDINYDQEATNDIESTLIADVTIDRKIKEGYNTVVLPFTLTANQVAAAFGSGTEVYAFSEDSSDPQHATVNFNKGDGSISANVPVLMKATAESDQQVFEGVQIVAAAEAKEEGTNFDFVGVYAPTTVEAGDWFIGNGAIYKSAGATNIKAFRAFLDNKGDANVEARIFIDGVETTGINEVIGKMSEVRDGSFYDLQGRKVANPSRGLYIINGKKVVIK